MQPPDGPGALACRLAALEAAGRRGGGATASCWASFALGSVLTALTLLAALSVALTAWQQQRRRRRLLAAADLASADDTRLRHLMGDLLPAWCVWADSCRLLPTPAAAPPPASVA